MESQAHALALALAAESDLALCPVCFLTFREQLEDNLAVHRLRVNAHPFWTSLMRFVTVARVYTAGICERISERLWMNWCRCRQCRPSSALQNVNRTRPFFEMTMRSACRLLHLCLSVPSKHGRPLRVFAHNRGLWPTTREQLVPYGAPQTIRALVQCHRNLTPTMALIVMLLIRFRPLLYPEIVKDDNRLPLVSSLITTIECYAYDAPNSQRTRLSGTPEGTFLYLLKEGPGVQADDARQFTVGQELELYHALVQLPTSPHCADEQSWWTYSMTVLMLSLLERLPVEERADPPYFLRDFVEQTSRRTRHPYVDFRGMYRYVQDHGSCFGPGCDKAPPSYTFSLCAKCRVVKYCSRDCQRNDWKNEPFPHREICDIFHELLAVTDLDAPVEAFAQACRDHAVPEERLEQLCDWVQFGVLQCERPTCASLVPYPRIQTDRFCGV
ncbi:hypothetical protein EXIGLDRAFT_830252 [Exidia glandulosa HHB12029]|uniref:MYND-type domain-containing protein n=1 Tax=Exidia glandulosa HHB12029 TaxID=1314781 RepID=A0A165NPU6_EXIGL|nr:hypothetical protein EXIGLDRAFT_830252 [Exidia glandulosa HHB12029]